MDDAIACACAAATFFVVKGKSERLLPYRYFQCAQFITIVGVGKIGAYYLVHGDAKAAPVAGTTLRFTGPVPADSRQ